MDTYERRQLYLSYRRAMAEKYRGYKKEARVLAKAKAKAYFGVQLRDELTIARAKYEADIRNFSVVHPITQTADTPKPLTLPVESTIDRVTRLCRKQGLSMAGFLLQFENTNPDTWTEEDWEHADEVASSST